MKTQLIFCLLFITLASFSIHAQTRVEPAWVKHFGSCQPPEKNAASAMEVDRFGNVYVTGYKGDSLEASRDYATIKYDTDGIEEWIRLYNNNTYNRKDEAVALALYGANNVYVTGRVERTGYNYSGNTYAILKYNSSGTQRWVVLPPTSDYYDPVKNVKALFIDKGGNIYLTLDSYPYGSGIPSVWGYLTDKYNSDGNREWSQVYYTRNWDSDYHHPTSIAVDILGNVYVTGRGYKTNMSYKEDYATIKYNSIGTQKWIFYYNGPGNSDDCATAIAVDDSGYIYVTGWSVGNGTGRDYATIKYDPNGDIKWIARYNNGPANPDEYAVAIAIDKSNNIIVTGRSWGSLTSNDYATVKYDRNGNEQWVARYNDPRNSDDFPTAMVLDKAGNIYITAYSLLDTDTTYDYLTVKYNPAGELQWAMRYDHPSHANDYARDIAVDDSGNVYVTGTSYGNGWSAFTTIKYVQFTKPLFAITPDSVDFGQVLVSASKTISVTVSNPGADTLIISRINIAPPGEFAITPNSATILPGETAIFQISFEPNSLGEKFARTIFYHNAPSSPDTVNIRGIAMQSLFSIQPTSIDFGKVETDTLKHKPIVVSNQGNIELKIIVQQSPDTIFQVQPESGTVASFDTLVFTATFKPNVKEVFSDTVIFKFLSQFNGNRFDSTVVVLLKGQGIPVSVEERGDDFRPVSFRLHQNYPNPFNPLTTISYSLPKPSQVMLKIFDILGHEIATLVNERQEAGEYKIDWQAAGWQSGIYVCRLQAGEFSAVRKIILLK